jgi:hypothetical protein
MPIETSSQMPCLFAAHQLTNWLRFYMQADFVHAPDYIQYTNASPFGPWAAQSQAFQRYPELQASEINEAELVLQPQVLPTSASVTE